MTSAAIMIATTKFIALEFTNNHLLKPDAFSPHEGYEPESDLYRRLFIRFTIEKNRPICAITKESIGLEKTIAVCQKCFVAFLATNLESFFLEKSRKNEDPFCPNCNTKPISTQFECNKLASLQNQIDAIQLKIEKLKGLIKSSSTIDLDNNSPEKPQKSDISHSNAEKLADAKIILRLLQNDLESYKLNSCLQNTAAIAFSALVFVFSIYKLMSNISCSYN